ncbi:LacI family transcriptional regulator [Frigoribacterium sp. NBH87]|uniref:LacI family DNA-binding transcriptional regulator n=1 Tax=Frigoribacterium sp. NBH87 TaxID=2596916 RepID=UPI001625CA11|nr:LacI family DNA-binding transcriptional regulator [Frigoribacterium sp. NBH87]QNE44129.1 LacI family transcriptional regulator [Frigoribacterium sp. NBH87]
MTKAPTVYDVAAHAGVSIATVSRVLRRPDDVRPETRTRVLESVRSLGYVPSGAARGLAGRRHGVLGLFLPGHDGIDEPEPDWARVVDPGRIPLVDDSAGRGALRVDAPTSSTPSPATLYFDEVLRGAEVESWRRGFALMVAAGRGSSREVMLNDIAGRVDGLAVLAQTVPDDLLAHVSRRIPVVVLADSRPGDQLDHVSVDNVAGMRALTAFVLEGHRVRDVAYVTGPTDSPDEADRHRGFDEAVAAAPEPVAVRVERGDFSRDGGRRAGESLLASGAPLPRAVVCANDQTALGLLDVLAEHGVAVPGQVLVTGFDGIEAGRFSTPRLTTVRQPMGDLGRVAVRSIVTRLTDPGAPPQRVTLPVEVLLRESCPAV